jgi:hypothetical protein
MSLFVEYIKNLFSPYKTLHIVHKANHNCQNHIHRIADSAINFDSVHLCSQCFRQLKSSVNAIKRLS